MNKRSTPGNITDFSRKLFRQENYFRSQLKRGFADFSLGCFCSKMQPQCDRVETKFDKNKLKIHSDNFCRMSSLLNNHSFTIFVECYSISMTEF